MNRSQLLQDIRRDEGRVPHAYQDSEGWWTIGDGILIDRRRGGGLRPEEMDFILNNRLDLFEKELDGRIPWWRGLKEPQQRALMNMGHQLGIGGLMKFKSMLQALQDGNGELARKHALDSLWAKQTPERAERVSALLV